MNGENEFKYIHMYHSIKDAHDAGALRLGAKVKTYGSYGDTLGFTPIPTFPPISGTIIDTGDMLVKILRDTGGTWLIRNDNTKAWINVYCNRIEPIQKEATMRKCVADVYEKTADAVLVDRWGSQMGVFDNDSFGSYLFTKDHKAEILAEAQRLEEESNRIPEKY